jgi:hypothetical protein
MSATGYDLITEEMLQEALDRIEKLKALLREARQYVSDAVGDEDSETQSKANALLIEILQALM